MAERELLSIARPSPAASVETSGPGDAPDRLLQVGELAALVGKTVRAIHHYEELGLIAPDARSKGRFRLYDHDAVTRVRWISKLHDLGLSLTQIQEMVASFEHAPSAGRATAQVRAVYTEKLAATREQITHLRDLERELEESIRYLDACEPCDTTGVRRANGDVDDPTVRRLPVMDPPTETRTVGSCVRCETRDREHEPELVAGLLRGSSEKTGRAKNSALTKP